MGSDLSKPGFVAIYIDATKMVENNLPFAVVIDNNEIKCYGVSRDNWEVIEKGFDLYTRGDSCKPVVYLDEGLRNTAKQMGWVIVGSV